MFTVDPGEVDGFLQHQLRHLHEFIVGMPGFVSSSWHRSTDGTTVVNYAQWDDAEAMHAAHRQPEYARHIAEAVAMTTRQQGHFFTVVDSATAPTGATP